MKVRIAVHGLLEVEYHHEAKLSEFAYAEKSVELVKELITHAVKEAQTLLPPANSENQ